MHTTAKQVLNKYSFWSNFSSVVKKFNYDNTKLGEFVESLPEGEFNKVDMKMLLAFASCWDTSGKNCFSINAELTLLLLATELPDIGEIIPLPYETFVIDLPKGLIKDLDQVGLTRLDMTEGKPGLGIICTRNAAGGTADYMYTHVDIQNYKNEFKNSSLTQQEKHVMQLAFRIIYNFCFWLAAMNPKAYKTQLEKAKSKKELKDLANAPSEWMLGRNVKLHPELRKIIEDTIISYGNPAVLGKIVVRFMVRGHFRRQACGFQRTLRKLIWIEPFMKGPEGAEAWAHIYQAAPQKHSTLQA